MSTPLKAIETAYAGCRFRSRLEARWAVFFDNLGIRWEYEPQGVLCTYRLSLDEGEFPYLPDFWLRDLRLWAEVKGSLTQASCLRLLDAAAHLSSNGSGGCHDNGGNDMVILGSIPREETRGWASFPWRLHMHKGDLQASVWDPEDPGQALGSSCPARVENFSGTIATDYGGGLTDIMADGDFSAETISRVLLNGPIGQVRLRTLRAYTAARSARFEHGEHP